MNWHSAHEFFRMGGYALFVWGSVAACVAAVVIESVGVHLHRRQVLSALRSDDADGEQP